jgi:PPOX class probable F420-dependent enzyme
MRLDEAACRSRLAGSRVAVLATVSPEGRPHLVPITFELIGSAIVLAVDQKPKSTTQLRRLRNIAGNDRVAVLAQHYDEDWSALWWVRADGRARVLTEPADRDEPVRRLSAKYPRYRADPPQGPVIRIEVERWAGWSYADTDHFSGTRLSPGG